MAVGLICFPFCKVEYPPLIKGCFPKCFFFHRAFSLLTPPTHRIRWGHRPIFLGELTSLFGQLFWTSFASPTRIFCFCFFVVGGAPWLPLYIISIWYKWPSSVTLNQSHLKRLCLHELRAKTAKTSQSSTMVDRLHTQKVPELHLYQILPQTLFQK